MKTTKVGKGTLKEGLIQTVDAARLLGKTRRTFDRWLQDGRVSERWQTAEGTYFYDPDELENIALEIAEEKSDGALDQPTAALLHQAYKHNEVMLAQMKDMTATTLEAQKATIILLQERCAVLEKSHNDAINAREDALSHAAERDSAALAAMSEQTRKDKIVDNVFKLAPEVMKAHRASKTSDKLLKSLTTEQVNAAIFLGTDMWSEEQLEILKQIQTQMMTNGKPAIEETVKEV